MVRPIAKIHQSDEDEPGAPDEWEGARPDRAVYSPRQKVEFLVDHKPKWTIRQIARYCLMTVPEARRHWEDIRREREVDVAAEEWMKAVPDAAPFKEATAHEKVEFLLARNWHIKRIAQTCNLPEAEARAISISFYDEKLREIANSSEDVRIRHAVILEAMATRVANQFYKVKDPVILDRLSKRVDTLLGAVRTIYGFDAPRHSTSLTAVVHAQSTSAHDKALLADPEYQKHVLALEQIERDARARAQGTVPQPGVVRRGGNEGLGGRPLGLPSPSGAAQRGRDGDRGRRDQPPVDELPAPGRQVDVHVDDLPGLVSGPPPGSAGDLG